MLATASCFYDYGLNMDNPAVQGLANIMSDPGSNIPGSTFVVDTSSGFSYEPPVQEMNPGYCIMNGIPYEGPKTTEKPVNPAEEAWVERCTVVHDDGSIEYRIPPESFSEEDLKMFEVFDNPNAQSKVCRSADLKDGYSASEFDASTGMVRVWEYGPADANGVQQKVREKYYTLDEYHRLNAMEENQSYNNQQTNNCYYQNQDMNNYYQQPVYSYGQMNNNYYQPNNMAGYNQNPYNQNMNYGYYQQPMNNMGYNQGNYYYQPQQNYGYDQQMMNNSYYPNIYPQQQPYGYDPYQQPQQSYGYYQQPAYNIPNNNNIGFPMVYDHKAYNDSLLQQYRASGGYPMTVRSGDHYEEYNPGFEYFYYPTKQEIDAAYNYFSNSCDDTAAFLSSDPTVVPESTRRFNEWLSQFDPPKPKTPEEQIMEFLERRNGPHDESDEHFHEMARKLYQEGKISLGTYTAVANGGFEYTTDNGVTVNRNNCMVDNNNYSYSPFGWGNYNYMNRQSYEQYMAQQKAYEQHVDAMNLAFNVARRFNGITDQDIQIQQQQQMQEYRNQQIQNIKLQKIARQDYMQDMFAESVKNCTYSDEPGYISPTKQNAIDHFNKVYKERHKRVDPDMSFKEFMIGGGYAQILYDDIRYQNRKEVQNLINLYEDINCKDFIHNTASFYDVQTGKAPKGFRMNKNEIEISVPPELMNQGYDMRRATFFSQIQKGHKHALQDDTQYLASVYVPGMTQAIMNNRIQPGVQPGAYMRM